MKKAKKWRRFEIMVASIKRQLETSPGATVRSPVHLPDLSASGALREFDVLVTSIVGGETVRVAFECKDYTKRLDVKHVEGFLTKLRDCHISKGVLVSKKGFSSTALAKAQHYGITCCTLAEVKALRWLEVIQARMWFARSVHLVKFLYDVGPLSHMDHAGFFTNTKDHEIVVDGDAIQPPEFFRRVATSHLTSGDVPLTVGSFKRHFSYRPDRQVFVRARDGSQASLVDAKVEYHFEADFTELPVSQWSYGQAGQPATAGVVVVGPVRVDGRACEVRIVVDDIGIRHEVGEHNEG